MCVCVFYVVVHCVFVFEAKVSCFLCSRVSLEDLYNGKTTKLQLSKNVLCGACNGCVFFEYCYFSDWKQDV